jgi:tripartite-type tricarboxylate transporter receptor subunit TctC
MRLAVVLLLVATGAWAQAYPDRPVRVVVPFPPGGAPDLVARALATRLAARLGQPFVVENRSGAGGNIAAEAVARAAPDGHTLFASSDGPLVINPNVYESVPFDTLRDFAPVSLTAKVGLALMACSLSDIRGVVEASKSRNVTYASSGFGSSQHLAGAMFDASAGIRLVHVPYKGFGPAVADAVACNVDLIFGAISTGLPYVRAGKLKALAVTTARRHPALPDTPTFAEAGHPAVAIEAWFGLLAPARTPPRVIERLHTETVAILGEPETAERLAGAGLELVGSSPREFEARIRSDLQTFSRVAKSLGAKVQ